MVDVGLIELSNVMTRLEEQAGKELGQWVEKSSNENINVDLVALLNKGRERVPKAALEGAAPRKRKLLRRVE